MSIKEQFNAISRQFGPFVLSGLAGGIAGGAVAAYADWHAAVAPAIVASMTVGIVTDRFLNGRNVGTGEPRLP